MRPDIRWQALNEYFTPPSLREDPEAARRARLIIGFGLVGSIFGPTYAAFYLLIGHGWGAAVIVLCTLAMAAVPWILKRSESLVLTGNLHAFILAFGFAALTAIEGGVHGHAIAWLASVPLCVLLLVGARAAQIWCGICFLVTLFFCVLEGLGIITPVLYPSHWHSAVTAAGFLGLVIFMSVIGLIFETGRKRAFGNMQGVLQELSKSNAQLKLLNMERNEILAVAAHDMKNPLNEIVGYSRLIVTAENPSVEQVKRDAGEILKASMHMHRLVSDLLDMQAIEEGHYHLKKEVFDLAGPVFAAAAGHRAMAERKQINLHLKLASEPMVVDADYSAVLQVVNNLISNAIKFSPPGRDVFVRLALVDDRPSVEVEDQGPGISADDRERMFKKFARLSAKPTAGELSTGLGLSIVKRLAELMGGGVQCRSEVGKGATFVVSLVSGVLVKLEPREVPVLEGDSHVGLSSGSLVRRNFRPTLPQNGHQP